MTTVFRKEIDGLPRLNDIEHFHKRPKQNKLERKAQVEAGREGRGDFGKPKKRVGTIRLVVIA